MLYTSSFQRVLCVFIPLLCSSIAFSQVQIKETISISPKAPTLIQEAPPTHTLRFEGTWDVPIFARMYTSGCNGRFDTGTSAITYEVPLTAGSCTFDFQPRVAELLRSQVCNVTLKLKLDGTVVMQASASFAGGSSAVFALWPGEYPSYTSPYNTSFFLYLGDSLFYEEGWIPWIEGINTCDPWTWDPASPVTLQIVSGTEFAQFYDYNTRQAKGISITGTGQQINDNYELVPDGILPDSSGALVTVQATSGGITQTASVKIKPYYFNVTADPPRVNYGEGAKIRATMVDAYGNEHYRATTPSVRIRIADSLDYGTLWYGSRDSSQVRQMADTLTNIPSIVTTQSSSGVEARFYAIEQQPKDSVHINIAVEKTGEGFMTDSYPPNAIPFPGRDTVRGRGEVTVVVPVTKKLKIVDHSPWEIWPKLPPDGRDSRGADRPGYNPKRSFNIKVTDADDEPLSEEEVIIWTRFQTQSGGHQHDSGTVTLSEGEKQGVFYGQEDKGNPLSLITGDDAIAVVDSFVSSQISGAYLVTARLVSDTTVEDTVNLHVRVPGLVNFRDLIILDERPFEFLQSPTGTANHPRNIWCTPEMGDSLYLAILDFYEWSRITQGRTGIQTSINDMSLVWGGLFDIAADWNLDHPSHSFHRVGLSVDINMGEMDENQLARLTRFVIDHNGKQYPEKNSIHYSFNGGN